MPSFGIGYQSRLGADKEGLGLEYAIISSELGQRHLMALKWSFGLETGRFKESLRLDKIISEKREKLEPFTVAVAPFDTWEYDTAALMIREMFIGFMAQTGVLKVIEVGGENFAQMLEPVRRCAAGIAGDCKEVSFKGAKYLISGKVEKMQDGGKDIQLMIVDMEKGRNVAPVSVIADEARLYAETELLSRKLAHKFILRAEEELREDK